MKNRIFGGIIFGAGILALYHLYQMTYVQVQCITTPCNPVYNTPPTDLLIATVIMLVIGAGVLTKIIRVKNA